MTPKHGTRQMYRERHCRCDECRGWNAAQKRAYDQRVLEVEGISVTQKYQPGATQRRRAKCASCEKQIWASSEHPRCAVCRKRAKRGIEIPAEARMAIYERDHWTCGICETAVDPNLSGHDTFGPTLDHIVPRSLGGSDEPENLRLAHRYCNSVRGAKVA